VIIVRPEVRPTCTAKSSKERIIGFFFIETIERCDVIEYFGGQAIYKEDSGQKCLVPKFQGHGGVCQECEAHLNYMAMFPFGRAILLMRVWAGDVMRYANAMEK
jgi:hypothetical protein